MNLKEISGRKNVTNSVGIVEQDKLQDKLLLNEIYLKKTHTSSYKHELKESLNLKLFLPRLSSE